MVYVLPRTNGNVHLLRKIEVKVEPIRTAVNFPLNIWLTKRKKKHNKKKKLWKIAVKKLVIAALKSAVLVIETAGAGSQFQLMEVWGIREAWKEEDLQRDNANFKR